MFLTPAKRELGQLMWCTCCLVLINTPLMSQHQQHELVSKRACTVLMVLKAWLTCFLPILCSCLFVCGHATVCLQNRGRQRTQQKKYIELSWLGCCVWAFGQLHMGGLTCFCAASCAQAEPFLLPSTCCQSLILL